MRARAIILFLVSWFAAAAAEDECPAEREPILHDEAKLHKDLFCSSTYYDFRPVKDHKSTVNVKVRLAIKYISFDPLEEAMTLHSWVALMWKDEWLPWDPTKYGGIKELQVESHEMWTPRMALFNADATMLNSDQLYTTCLVDNDGTVTCVPHLAHTAICRSTLRRWPYDQQNCSLYFGSWMHTGEQINFTFYEQNAVVQDDYQDGPGWKLTHVAHERLPGKYPSLPNTTYPMLKYTFVLTRVAAGPAAIVVVPSFVIVCLTLASLFLNVKDNVRLLIICFSLYGHFMFLTEIGYNVPKHSSETPILLLFVRDSMVVTLVGILETLLLMSVMRKTTPAPMWIVRVNRLVSSGPGRYAVFTEFESSDATKNLAEEGPSSADDHSQAADWVQFASILNSLCFIVATLTYFVLLVTYIPYSA